MSQDRAALPVQAASIDEEKMTLMEHLLELRYRLMWIVGALLVCTLLSMVFVVPIINFINRPLTILGQTPQALGPTDNIGIFFKVSFTMGTAFALPLIIYHVIAFMSPGLYPHERRNVLLMLPGVLLLFVTGAAFAFYMLVPPAVGFLNNFLGTVIDPNWTIDRYVGFVTRLVFWIGVAFELPLIMAVLSRTGLITGPQLAGYWRYAVIIVAVASAAITPTVDPVNMGLVMGPLFLLYLLSVGLAYALYKPRQPRDFTAEPFAQEYDDEEFPKKNEKDT
jgi:sec-independent protein translocase protein TatC